MRSRPTLAGLVLWGLLCAAGLRAQQPDATAANTPAVPDSINLPASAQPPVGTIPRLIKFKGQINPQVTPITPDLGTGVVTGTNIASATLARGNIVAGTITGANASTTAGINPGAITSTAETLGANTLTGNQTITGNLSVSGPINGALHLQPSVTDTSSPGCSAAGNCVSANVLGGYGAGTTGTGSRTTLSGPGQPGQPVEMTGTEPARKTRAQRA